MPKWLRSGQDNGRSAGSASGGRQDRPSSRLVPTSPSPSLERRTAVLEEGMEISDVRLDVMGYQIKVLLAQISIINEWINKKFGVSLIDEESQHFMNTHGDIDEIEEIVASLRQKVPPEIPNLACSGGKTRETQTEVFVPACTATVTDPRAGSTDAEVCDEDKSENIENNAPEQQRRVVVVNTDESSSDCSDSEVLQQSEDDRIDSDVSDLMIEVILGKSVTDVGKEKLKRFYSTMEMEEAVPSGGRRCPVEPLPHNDGQPGQPVSSSKLPTKAAKKSFLGSEPEARPKLRKRKQRAKRSHSGEHLRVVKSDVNNQDGNSTRRSGQIAPKRSVSDLSTQPYSQASQRKSRRRRARRPSIVWRNKKNTTKKLFNCKYCHTRFSQLWGLLCHVESRHNKPKMFKCSFCQCEFPNKTEICSHVLKVHRKRRVQLRPSKRKRIDGLKNPTLKRNNNCLAIKTRIDLVRTDSDRTAKQNTRF